jgi:hypothetical protein
LKFIAIWRFLKARVEGVLDYGREKIGAISKSQPCLSFGKAGISNVQKEFCPSGR